jgi:hypothetical protein
MEEALRLAEYLPVSYKVQKEEEYVAFLWTAFESNYRDQKYEFASLAFHLLYMTFVSFSLWQIRTIREQDFRNALIGFNSDSENKIFSADSPFKFYDSLKESQIFRFLKLLGCTNEHVGEFAKFVKRRNRIAHPTGTVFFNDKQSIDTELSEMMREVANIQQHMQPIILEVYKRFLIDSADVEEREYSEPDRQIEASLIHQNYISQKGIDVCLAYDLAPYRERIDFMPIAILHDTLRQHYSTE